MDSDSCLVKTSKKHPKSQPKNKKNKYMTNTDTPTMHKQVSSQLSESSYLQTNEGYNEKSSDLDEIQSKSNALSNDCELGHSYNYLAKSKSAENASQEKVGRNKRKTKSTVKAKEIDLLQSAIAESENEEIDDTENDEEEQYEVDEEITAALNTNNGDDGKADSKNGESHMWDAKEVDNTSETESLSKDQSVNKKDNGKILNVKEGASCKVKTAAPQVKKRSRKQSASSIKRKKQKPNSEDLNPIQKVSSSEENLVTPSADMQSLYMHIPIQYEEEDKEKPHKCRVCNRGFKRASHVRRHMTIHTGEKRHNCELCGKNFTTFTYLKLHYRLHTGEKPHQCEICLKKFTHYSNYKIHQRCHTNERPYPCLICGRSYTGSTHLKRHMLTHSQGKPYKCELCPKDFSNSVQLKSHMLSHSGLKPYACIICNEKFAQTYPLGKHMLLHGIEAYKKEYVDSDEEDMDNEQNDNASEDVIESDNNPVDKKSDSSSSSKVSKCKVCNKTFTSLKTHMRVHMGQKLFFCTFCDKRFVELTNMKQHMFIHTGERPYQCEECGKDFAQQSNLKSHMRIHTGERPYTCEICNKTFAHSSSRRNHMLFHTGETRHHCKHCGKGFTDTSSLKKHVRTHTGEKPYKCTYCGRGFAASSSLKTHMFTHGGSRPYKCDNCEKQFARPSQLQKHLLQRHGIERTVESVFSSPGFDHSNDEIAKSMLKQNLKEDMDNTEEIDVKNKNAPKINGSKELVINKAIEDLDPLISQAIEEVDRKIILEQTSQLSESGCAADTKDDAPAASGREMQ